MTNDAPQKAVGIQWKWVLLGCVLGLVIVAASYFVVQSRFGSQAIQMLVELLGFIVAGILIGYYSPGVTIREAAISGGITAIVMVILLLTIGASIVTDIRQDILVLVGGIVLSLAGAWVGEKLSGSLEEGEAAEDSLMTFHWKWMIVGVVLGFALNVLTVFLTGPLFSLNLDWALAMFCISTVVMGFVVGYKSPGVTLKEPAAAGTVAIAFEYLFVKFGMDFPVPMGTLVFGLFLGFVLSLCGAFIGEVVQAKMEEKKKAQS